jgi:hypothetical protein
MGEHHHPALVLHHLTHPAHPLKAAFSTNGNNEGWADIHTIYRPTYRRARFTPPMNKSFNRFDLTNISYYNRTSPVATLVEHSIYFLAHFSA